MPRTSSNGRPWDRLDVLSGVAALAVFAISRFGFRQNYRNICDDALISLRYAEQWVAGNGLVFNTGERVEGYTNFLWTVLLGGTTWLSQALGLDAIQAASVASSSFAALATVLVGALARRLFPDTALPLVAALGVCVVDTAYTMWAFQGLEGPFVAFWVLLAVWIAQGEGERRGSALGLALAALWLTRPDAGLFIAILLGFEALDVWRRRGRSDATAPARQRALVTAASLCVAIYGAYFVWRFQYYGFLLPNTFYVKVGGGVDGWARGWEYASSFVTGRSMLPLLAFAAVLRRDLLAVRVLGTWVLLHTLYIVSVGGDFYPGHRFFVPLIPAVALLLGAGAERVWWLGRRLIDRDEPDARLGAVTCWLFAGMAVIAWGQASLVSGPYFHDVMKFRDYIESNRRFMTWLGENSAPDATVLVGDVGSVGVFAKRRAMDFFGILDPEVAHQTLPSLGAGKAGHEKTASLALILERRPDYVKFGLLFVNFWEHGYYLDSSMPAELGVPGVWRLDALEEQGRYVGDAWLTDETESSEGWERSGEAFAEHPTRRAAHGPSLFVMGQRGGYASSYVDGVGAKAKGRLLSPPITLTGDRLVFRVGGGRDPERLRVCLIVDGTSVECTTGFESIALARREWDITAHRGKSARLELFDASDAPNGILLVDEVRQWVPHPKQAAPSATSARRHPRMPPGRWQRAPTPGDALAREAAQLQALGYVAGSEAPSGREGTTRFDRARTAPGINFMVSGHAPSASLHDLEGKELHRWELPFDAVWPDREVAPDADFWRRALPLPNGDLLAVWDGLGIVKLDRDSKLLWKSDVAAHHDLQQLETGEIVVLTRKAHAIPRIGEGRLFLEDFVSVLGPDGEERSSVSLLEGLEGATGLAPIVDGLRRDQRTDLLHANSVEVLTGAFEGRAPWLRAGNVLTSFREVHMLAVLDPREPRVVKAWLGDFRFQHDPKVLPGGTLLFFDNGTRATGSRIVELDLATDTEVWSYRADPPGAFFSEFCGTAQRLGNGNTLITESTRGRAFEVTPAGEIVWEWRSPHRAGDQQEFVASLLEVVRLPEGFGAAWRAPKAKGES